MSENSCLSDDENWSDTDSLLNPEYCLSLGQEDGNEEDTDDDSFAKEAENDVASIRIARNNEENINLKEVGAKKLYYRR